MTRKWLIPLCLVTACPWTIAIALSPRARLAYHRYLRADLRGLEQMRGEDGLPTDSVLIGRDGTVRPLNGDLQLTAPTDIALDLLIQISLLHFPSRRLAAQATITKSLQALRALAFHPTTGLYYRWYAIRNSNWVQRDISSIDNLHLAFALWATARELRGQPNGALAQQLFRRMNFSAFADQQRGVMAGNLSYIGGDKWTLDSYRYDYFGSEARSLYSLGAAIGIVGIDREFLLEAPAHLTFEMSAPHGRRILRTWNGGAFQLLLPELLAGEMLYSHELAASFGAYADLVVAEGRRRQLILPAAHSASVVNLEFVDNGTDPGSSLDDPDPDHVRVVYSGQAGLEAIGTRRISQTYDESTVPIHGVLLAGLAKPEAMAAALTNAQSVLATGTIPMFRMGFGFVDGVRVTGDRGLPPDSPLPVALSLDKEMEILAIMQILSADGLNEGARLLNRDAMARSTLQRFYREVDRRVLATPVVD